MNNLNELKQSRREFIGKTAIAFAGITIVPGQVISGHGHIPPSDKLNIAGIGIGGKGKVNLKNMVGQNMVALCDVDWDYSAKVFETYPKAKKWKDYREMLDKQKDIEAVVIATPDHTHAIIAMKAMQMGKHVYCQKPLTHSVWEARQLTEAAHKYKVATQMGNEGHSNDNVRLVAELIHAGVIGEVREIHATTNRPIWPQGLSRPAEEMAVPETLDWDLFIGCAPYRPYNRVYHPWDWRAWWDYGTGALGDMGCHVLDVPFYALNLKYPVKVHASSTFVNMESAPHAARVEFKFPARKNLPDCAMPELKLVWHDGGLTPEWYEELPTGTKLDEVNLFIGTKGKIISGNYGGNYKVLLNNYNTPLPWIERIPDHSLGGGRHEMDWVRACKENASSRKEACSNFQYSGPLTEMVVMGNLAIRLKGLNRELEWDGEKMQITNINPLETIKLVNSKWIVDKNGKPMVKNETFERNATEFAAEMVKHTYREGWGW